MITTARALVGRVLRPLLKAVEGEYRPGPYHLPISGGWLPDGAPVNWWQTGLSLTSGERSAVVERCIALYAETAASLPGAHWRRNDRGGRTRVENSALSRVLHRPNDYQTASSFMLNAVHSLYSEGNTYALALRNHRFEVESLHLMNPRNSAPMVAAEGSVFFRLAGNAVIDKLLGDAQLIVPQRDVLHIALRSNHRYPHPLVGETPLLAAMTDIAVGDAFAQQQLQFLANQSRPSAVLSTDLVLSREEVQQLRDRWAEQSKGLHAGGTPILTAGLKVLPWSTPAKDAQIAELSKLSAERICWAFGIPLQLLGLANTPATSVEALMSFWLSTGLGFCLNHVEQAFDRLFDLAGEPQDYTEFSTDALLRSAQKDRIEALARAVQTGIYSSNEARAVEGLDAVPFGDEPRVQAQNIPLSAAASIPAAPTPLVPAAPAATRDYPSLVQRDLDALRARTKRPERIAAFDGAAEPRLVIRKIRANETDADLRAKFEAADEHARWWPGLRSEYDCKTGKVEFLAAPIKLQAQEESTPAARGKKTAISNPERLYATQHWLHRDQDRGAMLPEHESKYGKAPILAKTIDGRLHLIDGHHSVFHHLREGKRALSAFVFKISTAIFQDGSKRG